MRFFPLLAAICCATAGVDCIGKGLLDCGLSALAGQCQLDISTGECKAAPAPTPAPVPTATPAPVPTATPAPVPTATPAPAPPVPTITTTNTPGIPGCSDNDAGLQSAEADGGNWDGWTCKRAAEGGYCTNGVKNKRSLQTHCPNSCQQCSGVDDVMVVNAESKCLKDIGRKLGKGDKHPARTPSLPKVNDSVVKRLRMSDWPTGDDRALRITEPGKYILEEDIVFDFPETPKNLEPPLQWDNVIGIAIEANGVELDLNGKTISMSTRFMARQRFFFHVQLNNMVFRPPVAHYNGRLKVRHDIIIRNGKFGQTSHMAIQGIENRRVLIEDLTFESFEVAAISCKDCRDVTIQRCVMDNKNLKVPLNTIFAELWSTVRWTNRFQNEIQGDRSGLMRPLWNEIHSRSIADAFDGNGELVQPNGGGLPQGSIFGIQLKTTAGRKTKFASARVLIASVTIRNIKNGESTRVGLSFKGAQLVCNNANVLDFDHYFNLDGTARNPSGTSAEILLFRNCVLSAGATFPQALKLYVLQKQRSDIFGVRMDRRGTRLKKFYGTDSRGHEPAGSFGIRVKGYKDVQIRKVRIDGVSNGETGFNLGRTDNLVMFSNSNHSTFPQVWQGAERSQSIFKLANSYGVGLDKVSNAYLNEVEISNIGSKAGLSFGVAIGGGSALTWLDKIKITNISVKDGTTKKKIPFIKQRPMALFVEESTKMFASRRSTPAAAWFAPTSPGRSTNWDAMKPLTNAACGTSVKPTPGGGNKPSGGGEGGGEGGGGGEGEAGGEDDTWDGLGDDEHGAANVDDDKDNGSRTFIIIAVVVAVLLAVVALLLFLKFRRANADKHSPYDNNSSSGSVSGSVHRRRRKQKTRTLTSSHPETQRSKPTFKSAVTSSKPSSLHSTLRSKSSKRATSPRHSTLKAGDSHGNKVVTGSHTKRKP
eukprot:GEMP01005513.1.p1 GENE.GEMP01005513.1~~GEMP01005513.1.p1  ORF type:complete len:931 (+),score=136.09 GEMP01005513.1:208-3000(+)